MDGGASGLSLVRRFWALYQARQWSAAQALLHPQAVCRWWATAERFDGAEAIVHVNAVYPEGWTIHLLALHHLDGEHHQIEPNPMQRVHSLVRVNHGEKAFYANSFFNLAQGLIVEIDEYWTDAQPAPDWRLDGSLPGLTSMGADRRPGLLLAPDLP